MAIRIVKTWDLNASSQYANIIDADHPLTIEQDGSIDDINLISATYFYVFNDGKRRDDKFDDANGTVMNLQYKGNPAVNPKILITPKAFWTTTRSPSAGTGSKVYLQDTQRYAPGSTTQLLKVDVGTVLNIKSGLDSEDILVTKVSGDANGSYVETVRNYKGSSTTGSALSLTAGLNVIASTKHIFMTTNVSSWPVNGGNSITIEDITNEINPPNSNPNPTLFQTIYIKVVPQLNKGVDPTNPQYVERIPTGYKTDVYFEISYRELPR